MILFSVLFVLTNILSGCGGGFDIFNNLHDKPFECWAIIPAQGKISTGLGYGFCKASFNTPGVFVMGYPDEDEYQDPESGDLSPYGKVSEYGTLPMECKGRDMTVVDGYRDPNEGPNAGDQIHLRAWVRVKWKQKLPLSAKWVLSNGVLVEKNTWECYGVDILENHGWEPTDSQIEMIRKTSPYDHD